MNIVSVFGLFRDIGKKLVHIMHIMATVPVSYESAEKRCGYIKNSMALAWQKRLHSRATERQIAKQL